MRLRRSLHAVLLHAMGCMSGKSSLSRLQATVCVTCWCGHEIRSAGADWWPLGPSGSYNSVHLSRWIKANDGVLGDTFQIWAETQ